MRLATIRYENETQAAVITDNGVAPVKTINAKLGRQFPTRLLQLIDGGDCADLAATTAQLAPADCIPQGQVRFQAPYLRPGKIWGIGLNYSQHAGDLNEKAPTTQPASFMKPATAVIGPGEAIRLPAGVGQVTAEAELGVIIGKKCRKVSLQEARSYIFGYTTIIDMTALDILQQNPRYLTRAKSFDTFFSFGPVVVTADEMPELAGLTIKTWINDRIIAENVVANMTFDPFSLVSFHSHVMTLEPGDIISTGTPGAGVIEPGDVARCDIDGYPVLENPVVDD